MQLALNFRGELEKVSHYLVEELDQVLAVINASWNDPLGDDDTLNDNTVSTRNIVAGSVTVEKLSFTPVGASNVVATINASSEGLLIGANKIQINGEVTFEAGYDPTGKIAIGGAATDVNSNTTTISGGKITTNSVTAAQLLTDLVIANKLRSSGATALGTGAGYWLDATGTPTFRVGDPAGSFFSWDGSNLEVRGDGYALTDAGGLHFGDADNYASVENMISWDSGALVGASATSTWITGPGGGTGMHLNLYSTVASFFANNTEIVKIWSDGKVGLYNGAQLWVDPTDTTANYPPLVVGSSGGDTNHVMTKTNGYSGTVTVVVSADFVNQTVNTNTLTFESGILVSVT